MKSKTGELLRLLGGASVYTLALLGCVWCGLLFVVFWANNPAMTFMQVVQELWQIVAGFVAGYILANIAGQMKVS